MDNQTENYPTACAHTIVERFRIAKDSRVFEEQWRCKDCGERFYRLNFDNFKPQIQITEPVKTLRDEFAIAAMIADAVQSGIVAAAHIGKGKILVGDLIPGFAEGAVEYYEIADAMMKARK